MRTFARALIFNYLVKGSDAHARNYSLLLTASGIRLAPLYDLNATVSFAAGEARTLAMSIGARLRWTRSGWASGDCRPT